jgi:beta-glucosidase
VIGRLADRVNLGDIGSSRVRPPYVVTPLCGIEARAAGAVRVLRPKGRGLKAARAAARSADAAVVVVGLDWRDEGENIVPFIAGDRLDLRLSKRDRRLILAVAEETPRVIVVVEGGSAVIMEDWRDRVAAILMAWYPGMEGGNALARVLFGDVNPSAKLPLTIPRGPGQLPAFDPKAREAEYGLYHGYRLLDRQGQEPAFAFGYGLSYTTYAYSNLRLDREEVGPGGVVEVSVDVTNSGGRAGEEIAQMYVACEQSKVERPVKELKGFARVALDPGETRTVTLTLPVSELAYWDVERPGWTVEELFYRVMVGPSSRPEDLKLAARFRVTGRDRGEREGQN